MFMLPAWATSTGLQDDSLAPILSIGIYSFLFNTQVKLHPLLQSSKPRRLRSFRTLPNDKRSRHTLLSPPIPSNAFSVQPHLSSHLCQPHPLESPPPFYNNELLVVFRTHLFFTSFDPSDPFGCPS